jgi:hypothetical protein
MKTYPVHIRSYVLVGQLIAEYKGKAASSASKGVTEFEITTYKAEIKKARVVDASFIDTIVDSQSAQQLSINCAILISPANRDGQYKISPKEVTAYNITLEKVSEMGGQVYGTLYATVALQVEERKFSYNPISIPSLGIQGTFPGYKAIPVLPTTQSEKKRPKASVDLKHIISGVFGLLGWALLFFLLLGLLSVIPPFLLFTLCGIGLLAVLFNLLPQRLGTWLTNALITVITLLFYLAGAAFVIWLGYILIGQALPFVLFWLPFVLVVGAASYILGNFRSLVKSTSILGLAALVLAIPVLFALFSSPSSASRAGSTYDPVPRQAPAVTNTPPVEIEKSTPENDSSAISQTLRWVDFSGNRYQITFDLIPEDIQNSKRKRESINLPIQRDEDFSLLFNKMLPQEELYLSSFISQLDSIRSSNNLDDLAFAEAVVSLVQQLEYALLFEQPCPPTNIPCQEDVRYGVYTPTEFLASLQGDCDTKSLLLYLVLREFGYDVAIIGSLFYQHAMLALDYPNARGASMPFEGDNFYVWEVTSPGWRLGTMPPQSDQLQFWNIIIAENNN